MLTKLLNFLFKTTEVTSHVKKHAQELEKLNLTHSKKVAQVTNKLVTTMVKLETRAEKDIDALNAVEAEVTRTRTEAFANSRAARKAIEDALK